EAAILCQRGADLSSPDDDDAPFAVEAENVAELLAELGHGIAETSFPERAEEREIFSDLGGGRPAALCKLLAGDRGQPAPLEILQKSEIGGESANGGIGNPFHGFVSL